jgi:hypothetical protein
MLLKSFLPKAEPVSVPVQNFEDRLSPVTEYKKVAGKRIKTQSVFHENREAVYCLSHVRASRREEDPQDGRKSYPVVTRRHAQGLPIEPLPISMR